MEVIDFVTKVARLVNARIFFYELNEPVFNLVSKFRCLINNPLFWWIIVPVFRTGTRQRTTVCGSKRPFFFQLEEFQQKTRIKFKINLAFAQSGHTVFLFQNCPLKSKLIFSSLPFICF